MRRTLALCLLLIGLPAFAQADADAVARELAGIRLVLERMIELRDVDVVLQRIALEERRVEPIERRARSSEARLERLQEEARSLESMAAQTEERIEAQSRRGEDRPDSGDRRMMEDIERSRKLIEERLEAGRYQAALIESDLAERHKAVEDLDDRLAELLESRRSP